MTARSITVLLTLAMFTLPTPSVAQSPNGLGAQRRNDNLPLKAWSAPLYFQPTAEEDRAAKSNRDSSVEAFKASTVMTDSIPAGALVFVAMTPCRIVDTRAAAGFPGSFGAPDLTGGATRTFPILSNTTCPLPATAQAYSFNITVVPSGSLIFLTVWPTGQPQPNASTLNAPLGGIVANAAVITAGLAGSVDVYASNNTSLIIDINGYYAPQSQITLAQGTAAAPALNFSGDTGTGIYSSGAGTVNIATGGTSRLTIRPDGDLDLAGSIRKGGALFLHNLGTQNTGVGLGALSVNTTGVGNTATGYNSLLSNTTGSSNTATGSFVLLSNTTGFNNTATGTSALNLNTTGNNNTATGSGALVYNTTGNNNTATGSGALLFNTTGSENTAIGKEALGSNTTGFSNMANGWRALYSNTTGNDNTATGTSALYANTTGNNNTATGSAALGSNTTGFSNMANGWRALYSNTTGNANTATGESALYSNTTGVRNTAIGLSALFFNTTGSDNTAIGYNSNVSSGNLSNATAIGFGAVVNASNKIRLGNSGVTVLESQVGLTVISDKNAKENFRPVNAEGVLKKVAGLSVPSWNYIGHDPKEFRHYGPMAQDFFTAFGNDEVGQVGSPTTINSSDVSAILMLAVQALEARSTNQQKENERLRNQNETLEEQIKSQEERIRRLETLLSSIPVHVEN